MFTNGVGHGRAVVLEIFVFFGIDQILGACRCARRTWAAGTRDAASAAARGLEATSLGQLDLIEGEHARGAARCEFAIFRVVQVMIAIKGHFLAGSVRQLIVRAVAGCYQRELYAFAVNVHLRDDASEISGLQGVNIAVPAFASSRSQNMYFQ